MQKESVHKKDNKTHFLNFWNKHTNFCKLKFLYKLRLAAGSRDYYNETRL